LNETYLKVLRNIQKVIKGDDLSIKLLLAGLIGGFHVLLEDYPGTGKTTLAKSLAKSLDLPFKRIQFTPDLLPSDITGVSIYNQKNNNFEFHKGPLFTSILLSDEINRASPRTQSALLEAMGEKQVTIDGELYHLDSLFFVIATQNPIEQEGTYPLPEAQMDRFGLKFSLGYLSFEDEVKMLTQRDTDDPLDKIDSVISEKEILEMREALKDITISDELKGYIVKIIRETRDNENILIGASSRATIALMQLSKVLALFDNSKYVKPDYIFELAVPVIAHRLLLSPKARFAGNNSNIIVKNILKKISIPI